MTTRTAKWLLWLALLGVAACGGRNSGMLEVRDVWGRNAPSAALNGAFYMTLVNGTDEDDQLVSVASDACGTTELHEMAMQADNVMTMRPVTGGVIDIPAGATVLLEVGGLHVMCLDKRVDFQVGDEVPLVLTFARAGTVPVVAEIRSTP